MLDGDLLKELACIATASAAALLDCEVGVRELLRYPESFFIDLGISENS